MGDRSIMTRDQLDTLESKIEIEQRVAQYKSVLNMYREFHKMSDGSKLVHQSVQHDEVKIANFSKAAQTTITKLEEVETQTEVVSSQE